MLASDLNNPEFVNPQNPDSLLAVEFYWHEPILKWQSDRKSEEEGKRVVVKGPRQPFVRIMRPGDQTSILEVPVREVHKQRWPERWLSWQIQEGMITGGENVPGWKVDDWDELNAEQKREMKYLRFYTVEMIAGASDDQLRRLGLGGMGLREKAKAALRQKLSQDVREQVAAKDKEVSNMKEQMAQLQAQLEKLTQAQNTPAPPKKPMGWPKGKKRKAQTPAMVEAPPSG